MPGAGNFALARNAKVRRVFDRPARNPLNRIPPGQMTVTQPSPAIQVTFNAARAGLAHNERGAVLNLPLPLLAGPVGECPPVTGGKVGWQGRYLLVEQEDMLLGATLVEAGGRLEDPVEQAYRALLELSQGYHLYRIWNFIPGINEVRGGLERYRQFNIGRWAAFESTFGRDLRAFMPAASAVGMGGDQAAIIFVAGHARPDYLENPSQIPAYHYPADYGPRPPGFARGVTVSQPRGGALALLSGTASIEGHRSIGEGDWALQFRTTLHNIEIMLGRMRARDAWRPDRWQAGDIQDARFKCYLRHAESLPLVREWIQESCGDDRHFTYLLADICRPDLDIEIEGFIRAGSAAPGHEN